MVNSGGNNLIIAITQHCFATYRRPIFQRLLAGHAGMTGRLLFGRNHPDDNVNAYRYVADIPSCDGISPDQYVLVKNRWITSWVLWQSGLLREVLRRDVKVVVMEGAVQFPSNWVAVVLLRLFTSKRVLLWTHGITQRRSGLRGFLKRTFWRFAHGHLLYGNRARRIMIDELEMNRDNLYVIYNSLDHDEHLTLRADLKPAALEAKRKELFGEKHANPILSFIGRLNHAKKLDLLLMAAHNLRDAGVPVNVLLIGDGDAVDALRRQANELGLAQSVCFHGACYDDRTTAELIGCSELCVVPGPIGLTAIHALTFGVPVITNDGFSEHGPEFEAITPGKTGEFFERGNVDSLVGVLSRWLTSNTSRDEIRRECYDVIDKYYNPQTQVDVFRTAIEGRPASECLLD